MIANTVLYWNFAKKIFDQQMLIIIERFKNKAYLLKKKISKEIMIIDSFLIIEKTPYLQHFIYATYKHSTTKFLINVYRYSAISSDFTQGRLI